MSILNSSVKSADLIGVAHNDRNSKDLKIATEDLSKSNASRVESLLKVGWEWLDTSWLSHCELISDLSPQSYAESEQSSAMNAQVASVDAKGIPKESLKHQSGFTVSA